MGVCRTNGAAGGPAGIYRPFSIAVFIGNGAVVLLASMSFRRSALIGAPCEAVAKASRKKQASGRIFGAPPCPAWRIIACGKRAGSYVSVIVMAAWLSIRKWQLAAK